MRKAVLATAVLAGLALSSVAAPRVFAGEPPADYYPAADSQTAPSTPTVDPRAVIYEKAKARAKARADRMAAREWLGIRPARPRALTTPFVGSGAFGNAYSYRAQPLRVFYRYR